MNKWEGFCWHWRNGKLLDDINVISWAVTVPEKAGELSGATCISWSRVSRDRMIDRWYVDDDRVSLIDLALMTDFIVGAIP